MSTTCSFTPFPVLTTERLVLRRVTMNDDKEIFFQRSDKGMNKYVNNPLAQTIDDARAWMEKIETIIDTNEGISWGVTLKGDDKLAGGFCYWNWEKEEEKAEIGFSIYPQHQNKGLMQEILQTCLKFGFQYMGLRTIEAYTHPENAASIKVLEKSGFRFKGMSAEDNYSVYELKAE
jgi:[ribosomal protein S5]-alanine N-acetyltransferase